MTEYDLTKNDNNERTEASPARPPYFELAQDAEGQWHWLLWAGNGRQMAVSITPFADKRHAVASIQYLRRNLINAKKVFLIHEA